MIRITPEALQYLKKKKKDHVIIEYPAYRTSCCSVSVPMPELSLREPPKTGKYRVETVDGIKVYVAMDVIMPENNDVTIELDSFIGIKSLELGGFDLTEMMSR